MIRHLDGVEMVIARQVQDLIAGKEQAVHKRPDKNARGSDVGRFDMFWHY